jgi:integrase
VYGRKWIAERRLAPRIRELYGDLFRVEIGPYLGALTLAEIKPATIRSWRKRLLDAGRSESQAVKAYRLLRAILMTAVRDDEILTKNACRIKGYDTYHVPERPTATVGQVYALAAAMPARFAALIVLAAFSGLRWGELVALHRSDVDLDSGTVRVHRKLAALRHGMEFGPPKSAAGVRIVALPAAAVVELRHHLAQYVKEDDEALLFTGEKGALLQSGNFGRAVKWAASVEAAGLPTGFHFHDLRHTGNTLAAASGAGARELMHRMGPSSMRVALIFQHATSERDREIAAGMDRRIAGEPRTDGAPKKDRRKRRRKKREDGDDGTAGVPRPGGLAARGSHARSKGSGPGVGPGRGNRL